MKIQFVIAVTILAAVSTVYSDEDDWYPCISDDHCEYDDCCVENIYTADGTKTCRDLSEFMRPCGGRFFCPCEYPLECKPYTETSRRIQGSNGTCQYPDNFEPRRRRPYY